MKYPIKKDFKFFRKFHPLINKATLTIINFVLTLLPKRRDKRVAKRKIEIAMPDGFVLKAYLFEPQNARGNLPCLVYFHGGGFIMRNAPCHVKAANAYCLRAKCKVLFVDYRLAPKNAFPTPFNDCFFALKYVFDNSDSLEVDKNAIAVGGDSAGGNLAACVCLQGIQNGLNVRAQMLIYPVIDENMTSESMRRFTDTPMWNAKLSAKMWKYYLRDKRWQNDERYNPTYGKDLSVLPETYVETAEFDCLRDEAKDYADKLKNAGVRVTLNETQGTMHGYDIVEKSEITKLSMAKRIDFLKDVFGRSQ